MPTETEVRTAYDEGVESVVELFNRIGIELLGLAGELSTQADAIEALKAQISKNSSNSGKPPSSDGYSKKNRANRTESLRTKSDKPIGGQLGHKGHTLLSSDTADSTERHSVSDRCQQCGYSLTKEPVSGHEERQVFDILAIHIEVTAHQVEIKICPSCGAKNKGDYPDGVTQATQYGNRVKTWASYFSVQHFIPVARTAQIFKDLLDHRVSEGTVLNACKQLSQKVSATTAAIITILHQAEVVHFDESGVRVAGRLHWLHSASTDKVSYYIVDPKRGQIAMDKMDIIAKISGTACHDHWKPYFTYDNCQHALCNAHHLRELSFLEKQYKQPFASAMADLLIEINQQKYACEKDAFSAETIHAFEQRYDDIVKEGLEANPKKSPDPNTKPKRGTIKQTPAYNMLKRLRDFKTAVLAFMYDFSVPFSNNQAEQDVRMIKVKQKVSGCFRRLTGAQEFVENRSYISTARKNGVNVFQAIHAAFDNNPFIPQI